MKQIIKNIQSLFNFDRFLLILFENELKVIATSRSIIIINISKYCCDALIIEKREFRILSLSYLYASDIRIRATTLRSKLINAQLLK